MPRRRTLILLLVSAALAADGCGPDVFLSEEGQWAFYDLSLKATATPGLNGGQSLLPGTEVCPQLESWRGDEVEGWGDDRLLSDCVVQGLEGPAVLTQREEETCIVVQEPGEVTWTLDPIPCDAPFPEGSAPVADRVIFQVADPDAVRARFLQLAERSVIFGGVETEPPDTFTEDDLLEVGDTFYVLGGQPLRLFVQLWDTDRDQPVAWPEDQARVVIDAPEGGVTELPELVQELYYPEGWIGLMLEEGARATLGLAVGDRTLTGATLETVPESELASLTLVATYDDLSDYGGGTGRAPSRARAILRDEAGHQVFGAPVEWWVTRGRLSVTPGLFQLDGYLPSDDYASVGDGCRPPSEWVGEGHAVLHARYGGLSDKVKLTWHYPDHLWDDFTEQDLAELDESFSPSEFCSGCACSGRGPAPHSAWLLAPAGLLLGLRRRG